MLNNSLNKRYVVITSPEKKQALKAESLELATCLNGSDGTELLIYRDNFIAYKVATLTSGQVRSGYIIVDDISADGDLLLEDGSRLRLEHTERTPVLS